jgi:hypothetical protein
MLFLLQIYIFALTQSFIFICTPVGFIQTWGLSSQKDAWFINIDSNNHIYQQMHIIGLQTAHKFKTSTCFATKAPSSGSLQYKGLQAPVHQSG